MELSSSNWALFLKVLLRRLGIFFTCLWALLFHVVSCFRVFFKVLSDDFLPLVNEPVVHLYVVHPTVFCHDMSLFLRRIGTVKVFCQPFLKHHCWCCRNFTIFSFQLSLLLNFLRLLNLKIFFCFGDFFHRFDEASVDLSLEKV